MAAATISETTVAVMRRAIHSPTVTGRYWAHVADRRYGPHGSGCLIWTGALSGQGHGRFYLGRGVDGRTAVVISHRWAFALAHGLEAMLAAVEIRHRCDNPLCQDVDHLEAGDRADNVADSLRRRGIIGNPLRDTRGQLDRAIAIRDAVRAGLDPADAAAAGLPEIDRLQEPLI